MASCMQKKKSLRNGYVNENPKQKQMEEKTVFEFSATSNTPFSQVSVACEADYIPEILQGFADFLRGAGFTYVTEIAAIYEDGDGITSEGQPFDGLSAYGEDESDE